MATQTPEEQRREQRRQLEAELEESRRTAREVAPAHGISLRDPTLLERALEPRSFPSHKLRPDFSSWLFLLEARRLHPEVLEDLYHRVFLRARGQDQAGPILDWLESYWLLEPWIFSESQQTLCWWDARERHGGGSSARRVRLPAKVRLHWGFEMEIASDRAVRMKAARIAQLYRAGAEPAVGDVLQVAARGTYSLGLDLPRTLTWDRGRESSDDFADRIDQAASLLQNLARFLRSQARGLDTFSAFRHFNKKATWEHYRWLVEKQIEGRSYSDLTRRPGQTFEAARNATQRLARRIRLTLRRAQ